MKKFEKILGITIIIGLILKLFLVPGGNILTVISFSTLAYIYFLLGFALFNGIKLREIFKKDSYKNISTMRIIGTIGFGIGLSATCIGILYKLQYWPGRQITLYSGLGMMLIILIIVLIKYSKSKSNYYKSIFARTIIIGGIGLILYVLPDMTIKRIQFHNHPDYIKAFEEYMENPQNPELREKMETEYFRTSMSEEEFKIFMDNQPER